MGRRKIQVQLISDDRTRHVTFAKRKAGLMKKAMELAILTGCEVALIVIDPSPQRELSEYVSTGDSRKLLQEYCAKAHLPHERKTNNDYSSMGRRKAKKPKNKGKKHNASSDDEDDSSDDEETTTLTSSTSCSNLPMVHEYPALMETSAAEEASGSMTSLLLSQLPEQPAVQQQIPQQQQHREHKAKQQSQTIHQQQQPQQSSRPAAAAATANNNPLGLTTEQIQQLNLFSEPVTPEMFQKIMQEAFSAALTATINAPIIGTTKNNCNSNSSGNIVNNIVKVENTNVNDNNTTALSTPSISFDSFLVTPTAETIPQQQPEQQHNSKRPSAILTKRPTMEDTCITASTSSSTLTTTIIPTSPMATSTLLLTPSVLAPSPAKKRKNDKFASLQVQVPVQQAPIRMNTGSTPTKDSCFLLSPLLPSTTSELFPPTPTN